MATSLPINRFRVENFKSVSDSGWIEVEQDVTAFVGKNESGKTALLKALYKLNPVDGEKPDGLREFPRGRYTYEFQQQDWPLITAEFVVPDDIAREISEAVGTDWSPSVFHLTRHYSNSISYTFDPPPPLGKTAESLYDWLTAGRKQVGRATSADAGEALPAFKTTVDNDLVGLIEEAKVLAGTTLHNDAGRALTQKIRQTISSRIAEPWSQEILGGLLDEIAALDEEVSVADPIGIAYGIVSKYLPVMIYFEDYSVLDDKLVISDFITAWKADPHDSSLRTKMALFRHVGLDPEDVAALGAESETADEETLRERKDERFIKLSSASQAMTDRFGEWWGQRRHVFRYQADADFFRVWVSDERNPAPIELEQRSRGLQWFFSFYLVFLVEAEEGHRNAILLLDEPGLHLHPTAQADLIRYFDRLSKENLVLYSTHSPFLVDGDRLYRTRVVRELDDGSTEVSGKVWPKDREALLPLQAALGYSLAQTLFIGKKAIVVEGITDYWLLKAMTHVLAKAGRSSLPEDVVIVPAGGAKEVAHFASLFLSNNVRLVALFDGDEPGRRYARELQKGLFAGSAEQIVFTGDSVGNDEAELEDLIPRDLYLEAVASGNPGIKAIKLNVAEEALARIKDALRRYAERKSVGVPDHALTAMALLDAWSTADPAKLPAELLDNFEALAKLLSEALERLATTG